MTPASAVELWEQLLALPSWQGFLLVIGLSVLVAWLIQVGGDALIRRFAGRIPGDVDEIVLRSVHPPLYVSVVLVGAFLGFRLLTDVERYVEPLRAGTLTLVTVVWAVQLIRMGRAVSTEITEDDRYDNRMVPIFENVWTALLLGGSVFLVLSYWDVNVTPLLASAGILGIVIGLAARDTIANFFGSIALYADGTYKVGDYIVLESGERGRVEDISIRSTVIRTRRDTLVTVPNSELNTATIVNESTPQRERRIDIEVGVAYGSDVDHVEETLLAVADAQDLVLEEPEPRVRFFSFGDSALELELRCWIPAPVLRERAIHRLNKAVYEAFREEDIEIPFPQRAVTVHSADDVTGSAPDRWIEDSGTAETTTDGDSPSDGTVEGGPAGESAE